MAHIEVVNGKLVLKDDWYIEDIMGECEGLTEVQAEAVLIAIALSFDANEGINWEVIHYTVDRMYPEDEE